jgi:hypothetical protein
MYLYMVSYVYVYVYVYVLVIGYWLLMIKFLLIKFHIHMIFFNI